VARVVGVEPPVWDAELGGPELPNIARIRDYWLGGSHHDAADRTAAEHVSVCAPHLPYLVRTQRAFLRRALEYLVAAGVRQFLDIGSGLPTAGNVHEVVQRANPACRVVYVDVDPVVASAGRKLLAGNDRAGFVRADLREPERVLAAPETRRLLDLTEPVAVLLVDVLHFVADVDDPSSVVAGYLAPLPRGSHLAVSHLSHDQQLLDGLEIYDRLYGRTLGALTFREPFQTAALLGGLDLVEPGVVPVPMWRPQRAGADRDRNPDRFPGHAGLGRKR
jgi:S-adenosyl methyltransferase